MDYGVCSVCSQPVLAGAAFVNIAASSAGGTATFVPVDEDIHGWTPFVLTHPACYASEHGLDALLGLVDDSHRHMRARQG